MFVMVQFYKCKEVLFHRNVSKLPWPMTYTWVIYLSFSVVYFLHLTHLRDNANYLVITAIMGADLADIPLEKGVCQQRFTGSIPEVVFLEWHCRLAINLGIKVFDVLKHYIISLCLQYWLLSISVLIKNNWEMLLLIISFLPWAKQCFYLLCI